MAAVYLPLTSKPDNLLRSCKTVNMPNLFLVYIISNLLLTLKDTLDSLLCCNSLPYHFLPSYLLLVLPGIGIMHANI